MSSKSLEAYRATENERTRTADLLRLVPRGRATVLDIGARDGHFSRLLTGYFDAVTALDLVKPGFSYPRVSCVAGDATRLEFPDRSFDCVFCTEVLEHIPPLETACREIARVARHEIVIGVPYRQDTRAGRTTCRSCGKTNPPWGHVNEFDEDRLRRLFPGLRVAETSFVGTSEGGTNALSAFLMDLGGNPWGTYEQHEACIHCGATLTPPPEPRPLGQKIFAAAAERINRLQRRLEKPHANWIHVVFSKD